MKLMNRLSGVLLVMSMVYGPAYAESGSPAIEVGDTSVSGNADEHLRQLMARAQRLRGEGRLYDAVEAFVAVLAIEPQLHRARLELALTQYALMNLAEARFHAQWLLDDPMLSPGIVESIRKLVGAIDAREQELQRRHSWQPRIGYSLSYDDNVNVGPSSDVIEIGDATYRLNAGFLPRGDVAQSLTLGMTHRYRMEKSVRVGQQAAIQYWQSEIALYQKEYREEEDFNLGVLSVSTGPAWVVPKAWRAHLKLQADHIRYGGDDYAVYGSLNPGITWQQGAGEIEWNASLMQREFLPAGLEDRNSIYMASGIAYGHVFGDGAMSVRGGLKLFRENSRNDYFSNEGHELYLGASYQPREALALYAKLARKDTGYEGVSGLFGTNRDERQWRRSIGAVYRIPDGVLGGVRVRADYTQTERDSSIPLYRYDRNLVTLSLEFAF